MYVRADAYYKVCDDTRFVRCRRVLGLAVAVALGALPVALAGRAAATGSITLRPGVSKAEIVAAPAPIGGSARVTISGLLGRKSSYLGSCVYDAFYGKCKSDKWGSIVGDTIGVSKKRDGTGIAFLSTQLVGRLPAFRADHRYGVTLKWSGPAYFVASPFGGAPPTGETISGSFTLDFGGEASAAGGSDDLRVNFVVNAFGKPNVAVKGYRTALTLVSSRVKGSGHATFTEKEGSLLVATETKGSIVHEDVYSDGTKHTLTFGVVSGTRYFPAQHRLVLVLKAKDSNDPACEVGDFISTTFGTLTLLPHEDAAPNGGTALFVGVPKTKLTTPCRHAHGWKSSPGAGVTVRILLGESKP